MEPRIFEAFRDLVYAKSGITLREGKESMVSARVAKRMRSLGLARHEEYLRRVQEDESGEEVVQLLDAISTNVTKFFRESKHFDFLAKVVGEWLRSGQRRFRFLKPGGYLMVGHAESLTGMVSDFRTVVPSIYVKG